VNRLHYLVDCLVIWFTCLCLGHRERDERPGHCLYCGKKLGGRHARRR